VQRYLTWKSVTQSRLGLLANGLFKVPMQFLILLIGALVFVYYQFAAPPVFFNPAAVAKARSGAEAAAFQRAEQDYRAATEDRRMTVESFLAARRAHDSQAETKARAELQAADARAKAARDGAVAVIRRSDPGSNGNDVNYVFLSYVLHCLPAGVIGLVLAAVFSASMSSMSAEINALGATTVVDIWRRLLKQENPAREVWVSRLATFAWGCFALGFAQYASRLGSLVEAVNILGSLFYGTILGIFLVAFYVKRIRGGATFWAALVAEAIVLACFAFTRISFLWFNVVGCAGVVLFSLLFHRLAPPSAEGEAARTAPEGAFPTEFS
jgi:hypothetical protein